MILLRVPERVRRPSTAREALGFSPLVQAGWADSSCVEGVPLIAAGTEPFVFFAGRPATERAADAWGSGVLPPLKVAVWSEDRVETHLALGEAYLQAHDPDAARGEGERALALAPDSEQARSLLQRVGKPE